MEPFADTAQLQESLQGVVKLRHGSELHLLIPQMFRGELVDRFVYTSILGGTQKLRHLCSLILRSAALAHGIWCDSIHDFFRHLSGLRNKSMTVPAFNVRGLSYSTIRTIFRVAQKLDAGPFLIEISPTEMSQTQQRTDEIAACVLGAALRENYSGPVFIQGDHFKVDYRRNQAEPPSELPRLQNLITDAIHNGFYNFDIDALNSPCTDQESDSDAVQARIDQVAQICAFIRKSQPEGVTIAIGVELASQKRLLEQPDAVISELDRLNDCIERLAQPAGLTKLNVHLDGGNASTGQSVPQPVRSLPALTSEELATLDAISDRLKAKHRCFGLELHSSSSISDSTLKHLSSCGVVEVHLGTRLQDIVFDHPRFPIGLTEEIHSYLETHCPPDSRSGLTQDQFYYGSRKRAWGPFKKAICSLDERTKSAILQDVEKEITMNFEILGVSGQRKRIDEMYPEPASSLAVMPKF